MQSFAKITESCDCVVQSFMLMPKSGINSGAWSREIIVPRSSSGTVEMPYSAQVDRSTPASGVSCSSVSARLQRRSSSSFCAV